MQQFICKTCCCEQIDVCVCVTTTLIDMDIYKMIKH